MTENAAPTQPQPTKPAWLRDDDWPIDLFPPRRPILFVISGPSGVGKDAVIDALKREGFPFHYVVTATTRQPRPGEVDGVHYHFLTPERFAALRDSGGLLEWANVHGREYGSPRQQIVDALAAGRDVLLKIDVQGAAQVRERVSGSVSIFIGPPSFDELVRRLEDRDGPRAADREVRIANARTELGEAREYDYVVINRQGRLAEAVEAVKAIIQAERLRVKVRQCDLG